MELDCSLLPPLPSRPTFSSLRLIHIWLDVSSPARNLRERTAGGREREGEEAGEREREGEDSRREGEVYS